MATANHCFWVGICLNSPPYECYLDRLGLNVGLFQVVKQRSLQSMVDCIGCNRTVTSPSANRPRLLKESS